jgi:nickel-dependent lactate racemase
MHVAVAYDGADVLIDVPDDATVISPVDPRPLPDPDRTVREMVRPWLRGLQPPGVLVLPDVSTFPQQTVLPGLLSELARVGLRREGLVLINGPGLSLDEEFTDRYPVHVHDAAQRDEHERVGDVDGVPVLFDRAYVEATTRITIGLVEPHHRCGFTGGPETVCPNISAEATVSGVHARGGEPTATALVLRGNPVHDFIRAAVKLAPPRLSIDVTIDGAGTLTGVWCGPLPHGHQAACAFVEQYAVRRVASRADVVIVSGEPLTDAVRSADRAVRPGGTTVVVTDAADSLQATNASVVVARPRDLSTVVQSLLPAQVCVLTQALRTVVTVGAP